MANPPWLAKALGYIGVAEIKGPHHNAQILKWLDEADGHAGDGKTLQGIRDDETPWCASFVSAVLEECGIVSARSAWARSYLNWGQRLDRAPVGAVVVFGRNNDPNSGHVSFLAGRDEVGNIMCCGGNQADMVRISAFNPRRVLGYRWPPGIPVHFADLPIIAARGIPSTNEA